jgi:hypothetical protein
MEQQRDFLFQTIDALERANIQYAITGSWASITYGTPRTTHDLDVVVSLTTEQAQALAEGFPPPLYADAEWMKQAAALGEFFNVIDPTTGLKVDFWPLKDEVYEHERFARRRQEIIFNRVVWMLSAEDVILSKLLWFKMSESQTQWRDIVSVWKVQQGKLDLDYLRTWAARLSIADLLARVTET